jgi:hypothetical protein
MQKILFALALIAFPYPSFAQKSCEEFKESHALELRNWELGPVALSTAEGLEGSLLPQGQRVSLLLEGVAKNPFVAPPERKPDEGTFAGISPLRMANGGDFRVSIGQKIWVDLVEKKSKKLIASAAHEMSAPDCGPIKKIVTFSLEGGKDYVLQFSGSAKNKIDVMVTKPGNL